MPAAATAEKQSPNRNQSMQENTAVLDTPEKENGVEKENTASQSGTVNSPAPNPTDGLVMAGNSAALPVMANADRTAPMNGATNTAVPVVAPEIESEDQQGEKKYEKGEGKSSVVQAAGGSDSGESGDGVDSPADSGSATGGAEGVAANSGDAPAGEQLAEPEEGEKEDASSEAGKKEAATGDEKEKSGKASGSSVLDFQASGKAMDKESAKPAVTDPEKDPAFKGVIQHTDAVKEEQNTHLPSETKLAETTASTPLTDSEQAKKNDQLGHLGAMNQIAESEDKKKEPFTPEKFKKLLQGHLTELSKQMPTNEDKAKEFKKNKPVEAVKEKIAADVKSENEKLSGPMAEQAKQTEPPASGVPATPTVAIPEEQSGPPPAPIDPTSAVPKEKTASELSMEKESQSLDDAMDANNVTDEQLAISNEPKFLEAKQSKEDAQAKAAAAPENYRAIEQKKLADAKQAAEKRGETGLTDMHVARTDALGNVLSEQQTTGTSDQDKQKEIYKKLETIYTTTKDEVKKKLDGLSEKVDTIFSTQAEQAKKTFEENVEERLDDIYGFTVIDDWLFGEDTEAIEEAFRIEKGKFERTMNSVIDTLATIIADELNATIEVIKKGKKDSEDYFNTLDKDQQKLATDAFDSFNDQYDTLEETVYEKQDELAQDLASSYKENVDSLRESFDAIKESVSAGWIGAAFNFIAGIIDTILKIKDLLLNLLSAVVDAIGAILSDPIGFLSNLISGIVQGFTNFKNNILNNIMTGLIEWLTGSLGGVGITIPDNLFSLGGIFDLVAQILGLTWDYFRSKAVKVLGEPVVQAMETGFEIFMIIKEKGIEGLWEYIKEQFNDLKAMVMDAIRDMIITKVIEAGVKWIMGLMSPAGAFVKAAMMIIDIAKFFIERAAQIIDLVSAFVDGIRALANGDVSAVAKAVEKALVKAIPVLIGFLASLVGITGLTAKVQKIIKRVRKRIDKAIDKIIKKGKKAFGKLVKKGKAKVKGAVNAVLNWWKKDKEFRAENGDKHEISFKKKGKKFSTMVASETPFTLEEHISKRKAKEAEHPFEKGQEVKLANALALSKALMTKFEAHNKEEEKGNNPPDISSEIESTLNTIATNLREGGLFVGEKEVPPTNVSFTMAGGKSKKVKADPLTKIPGNTQGEDTGGRALVPLGEDLKIAANTGESSTGKNTQSRNWKHVHLLSHLLHGPYQLWNIVIGDTQLNSDLASFEHGVRKGTGSNFAGKSVKENYIYYYEVNVNYFPSEDIKNNDNKVIGNKSNYPQAIYLTIKRKSSIDGDWESVNEGVSLDPGIDLSGFDGIDIPNTKEIESQGLVPKGDPDKAKAARVAGYLKTAETWVRTRKSQGKAYNWGRYSGKKNIQALKVTDRPGWERLNVDYTKLIERIDNE